MKIQEIENAALVPWDYSDLAKNALNRVWEMVGDLSKILVVHVSHTPSPYEYGMVWDEISKESIQENLEESFRKEVSDNANLKGVSFQVLFGNPGHKICDFAEEQNVDLIVVPSHGHTGLSRLVLGSVAERVVRFSPCPVLVLRTAPEK